METKRLIIEMMNSSDGKMFFDNIVHDKKVGETFLINYIDRYEDFDFSPFINNKNIFGIKLKENKVLIGIIDIVEIVDNIPEIGYAIGSKYWNKGYMKETLPVFINYLFENGFNKVVASHFVENTASGKVMVHAGMKKMFIEKNAILWHNEKHDFIHYVIEKEN